MTMLQTRDAAALSRTLDENGGYLPTTEALAIFRQLLAQVSQLHAAGRIHRAIGAESGVCFRHM